MKLWDNVKRAVLPSTAREEAELREAIEGLNTFNQHHRWNDDLDADEVIENARREKKLVREVATVGAVVVGAGVAIVLARKLVKGARPDEASEAPAGNTSTALARR